MSTAPGPGSSGRTCGIARKLGYTVDCPPEGCALLDALGYELPEDEREICPIEQLAHDDNVVVLWTFDELRRDMQRARALPSEEVGGPTHTDAVPRPS